MLGRPAERIEKKHFCRKVTTLNHYEQNHPYRKYRGEIYAPS